MRQTVRKLALFALALLLLAPEASAVLTGKTVAVTDAAQTVTFGGTNFARVYVSIINDGPDTVVLRLYGCGETVVPVVFADGSTNAVTVLNDESIGPDHNPRTQTGHAWCAASIIANTAATASVRFIYE